MSFSIAPGEVVGLLGKNGAGKTTLMRIAMGMIEAQRGDARLFGLDPRQEPLEVKGRVGYVSEAVLTAPDERFLIFYLFDRADKAGSGLYVSLRLPGDAWTEPVYMDGELGLDFGFDASLSPDGRYLFLLDRGVGVYWVDAQVIEEFVMR